MKTFVYTLTKYIYYTLYLSIIYIPTNSASLLILFNLTNINEKKDKREMLKFLLFTLFVIVAKGDLLADRLVAAEIWTLRGDNMTTMLKAYSEEYSTNETCHAIRNVGDYCPRDHALEYDKNVLDLKQFLEYDPVTLSSRWDPDTVTWVSEDVLRIDYYTYIQVPWSVEKGDYLSKGWYYYTSYLTFVPGTAQVLTDFGLDDPEATPAFDLSSSVYHPYEVCAYNIWPACRNHLNLTEFSTVDECIAFTSSLPAKNKCPFSRRSKTMECQVLHAISAFLLPEVHCQHVSPHSDKCQDTCEEGCVNCHEDSDCVGEFVNFSNPVPIYKCQCKRGFIGDGQTCVPATCQNGLYSALHGSYNCSSGRAVCDSTFTHSPETPSNLCQCTGDSKIVYENNRPVCVPKGRCLSEKYECFQDYSDIQCVPVNNTYSTMNECTCNYGFGGGRLHDCTCKAPKRSVWSNTRNSNLCLSADECTANWHCGHPRVCQVTSIGAIGKCAAPQKRGHYEEWEEEWDANSFLLDL